MKIKLSNISKQNIINNISFEINNGDRIALIGPNGAGKTTINQLILGLTKPTSGNILRQDANIATVFQNNLLDNELTVSQNLNCRITDKHKLIQIKSKLKYFNINPKLLYSELSGEQKRIVNYLRAIAENPNCLILDELSAGIDITIQKIIWQDLNKYLTKNNCGLLFTTHLIDELNYANKIIFINKGNILFSGSKQQFLDSMPKYKLIINKDNQFFNTSYEAVQFIESNHLTNQNFEIKKITYEDLILKLLKENNL